MTQTRKTYKTTKQNPKKYTSITFRVTEEEKTIIQKHAKETGCRTAKLTTVSGEGLRFFVAEADARQIPNPS